MDCAAGAVCRPDFNDFNDLNGLNDFNDLNSSFRPLTTNNYQLTTAVSVPSTFLHFSFGFGVPSVTSHILLCTIRSRFRSTFHFLHSTFYNPSSVPSFTFHFLPPTSCGRSRADGDSEEAIGLFAEDLRRFREIVPVDTISMHGSPLSFFGTCFRLCRSRWTVIIGGNGGILWCTRGAF